jgi:SAM-dependent methyltransferase
MNRSFKEYSEKHVHFIDLTVPRMLENLLIGMDRPYSLIDLGCGDGRLIYALHSRGLLRNAVRVVGVDISEERIKRFKMCCPFAEGVVADVQDLRQIPDNSFDIAISNQVIEHVPDDRRMLREVYRILKPGGYFYVSTVIKKWYGFWIYWNKGFRLDPTHVREYKSKEEFLSLLEDSGFEIERYDIKGVWYPVTDLLIRILIKAGIVQPSPDFYIKHKTLKRFRKLKVPVIGYKTIEVLSKVRK